MKTTSQGSLIRALGLTALIIYGVGDILTWCWNLCTRRKNRRTCRRIRLAFICNRNVHRAFYCTLL